MVIIFRIINFDEAKLSIFAKILSMKKVLFFLFIPGLVFSQIPTGYYDSASGLSGYALKSKLHEIISQKVYSYNYSEMSDLYSSTDLDHYYENDNTILDIYSENPAGADAYSYALTQNIGSASAEGQGWNREHGMPQSTFYGIYPMYSDLNYVIPTDAYINQRRSNYPYARNNASVMTFTNGSKLGKSTTPGYSNTVYEPVDEFKGDVARYLLYFVVRYEGSLNIFNYLLSTSPLDGTEEKGYEDWYLAMLKEWNTLDPVSQREIDRNNATYAIQKVRNPFIDHPEFVNLIWSETADTVAPDAPTGVNASSVGESFVKLQWQPSTSANILGYHIFQDGIYIGFSKSNEFIADRLASGTTYNFTVKAYNKGFLLSPESAALPVTTTVTDALAKDLMITKYVEGSTNNTAIEITNKTGHDVDLTHYYLSIQFKGANNTYYFSDTYKLEGKILPGESKVIVNPKSTFTDFAVAQGDFVTNATPMTFTGTQYVELSYGKKYLKTASTNNYDMAYTTVDAVGMKDTNNTNNNKSLYRNTWVTDPRSDFTIAEWTSYPSNYTVGLGEDIFMAVSDGVYADDIIAYPNPVTQDKLFLQGADIDTVEEIEILDFSGRTLHREFRPFGNKNYIDVSGLNAGIYYLKTGKHSIKFIKK